jgi:phage terminase large subunit-like protein
MLLFGLRLGRQPRVCVTTTPRRTRLLRQILKGEHTEVSRSTTFDNRGNLPASFFEQIVRRYEGTTLGRQELYAELIEDADGALWKREIIENKRVAAIELEGVRRIVVAIDPSYTMSEESDECGLVVAGVGLDGEGYVLEDASFKGTPNQWASRAVVLCKKYNADRIVAETNNGGDLVEMTLRTVDPTIPFKKVFASRGKVTRAEPVAALYEQGRVHHVGGFPQMEDEMCTYDGTGQSPNRMDALVWAMTELLVGAGEPHIYNLATVGEEE